MIPVYVQSPQSYPVLELDDRAGNSGMACRCLRFAEETLSITGKSLLKAALAGVREFRFLLCHVTSRVLPLIRGLGDGGLEGLRDVV